MGVHHLGEKICQQWWLVSSRHLPQGVWPVCGPASRWAGRSCQLPALSPFLGSAPRPALSQTCLSA